MGLLLLPFPFPLATPLFISLPMSPSPTVPLIFSRESCRRTTIPSLLSLTHPVPMPYRPCNPAMAQVRCRRDQAPGPVHDRRAEQDMNLPGLDCTKPRSFGMEAPATEISARVCSGRHGQPGQGWTSPSSSPLTGSGRGGGGRPGGVGSIR